ncbi:MAG: hypothetical protein CMM05_00650 [Rhodopirellula sp.]|nr:hypothetical protein [Rhodopirellula sp.]
MYRTAPAVPARFRAIRKLIPERALSPRAFGWPGTACIGPDSVCIGPGGGAVIAQDNAVIRKDDPVPANRISDNHAKATRAAAKQFDKDARRQNCTEEVQSKLPNATTRKSASEPPKAELRTDTPDRYSGQILRAGISNGYPGREFRRFGSISTKKGDRDLRGNEAPVSRIFEARGSRLQRDVRVRTSLTRLLILAVETEESMQNPRVHTKPL